MANSNEYMRVYMQQKWIKRRLAGIAQLGSVCVKCGTNENLQFDHINSSEKQFPLSKKSSCSEEKWQIELAKCQLLCESCHIAKSQLVGDFNDRERTTVCNCGKVFETMRSYAGHKRWCKE